MTRPYLYYARTGLRDTRRAIWPLSANVLIVAGICLPVLLLLGLKRGLVAQFRQDLLKSPTARRVETWATAEGNKFNNRKTHELETAVPGVSLVVPDIPSNATLTFSPAGKPAQSVECGLACTKGGDPFLQFYGADVLRPGQPAAVVSSSLAEALGIPYRRAGERRLVLTAAAEVSVRLQRGAADVHSFSLPVKAVFEGNIRTAYLDQQVMEWIEDFKVGRSVPAFNLPASTTPPQTRYDGYLAFVKVPYKGGKDNDLDRLHDQGLTAVELNEAPAAAEYAGWRTLYGLLLPKAGELHAYFLHPSFDASGRKPTANLTAAQVENITEADDVVLPWTVPAVLAIDGTPHAVVGVSSENLKWLGREYFRNRATRLDPDPAKEQMRVILAAPAGAGTVKLALPDGQTATLRVDPLALPAAEAGSRPLAVVSSTLAAYLGRARDGALAYDPLVNRFVPTAGENAYVKAYIYTDTLESVVGVKDRLLAQGYNPVYDTTRLLETMKYAAALDLLFWVVLVGVILFGVVTVAVVFGDLTNRKRGAIGIMRIMGMPRSGILIVMIVRGLLVGTLGWLVTVVLGKGIELLLTHGLGAHCDIHGVDYLGYILPAAVVCSLLGIIVPAYRAAYRLDPVDAIYAAKVQ